MARRTKASDSTEVERLRKSLARERAKRAALERSLAEAREQGTATADILNLIRRSPTDARPVFDAIVRHALALCGSVQANVFGFDGELLHFIASENTRAEQIDLIRAAFPKRPDASTAAGRAVLSKAIVRIEDALSDAEYDQRMAEAGGWRRALAVPMMGENVALGAIAVAWADPGPIAEAQEELLKIFADQAVIAIENVRLFTEANEALERQTATAEILKVISSSPDDITPVFQTILDNAIRLCGGSTAVLWRYVDGVLRLAAGKNTSEEGEAYLRTHSLELGTYNPTPRAGLERRIVHVLDVFAEAGYRPLIPRGATTALPTASTVLAVPLLREEELFGVITVWRFEKRLFSDIQIEMVKTFADQAVIAIENVRLFNELHAKNAALSGALNQQTATAEILRSMSSSLTDVQPVFETIVKSGLRLLSGYSATLTLLKGDVLELAALTSTGDEGDHSIRQLFPVALQTMAPAAQAVATRRTVVVEDIEHTSGVSHGFRETIRARGWRSALFVPMVRNKSVLGILSVTRRAAGPFTEDETALLETFADQAVIAIENVRLFNETKEALERQTATAEILKVIASSPSDVQPVFDAIATSARRLLGGNSAHVVRRVDETLYLAAHTATTEAGDQALRELFPTRLVGQGSMGKAILSRAPVWVTDFETDPAYSDSFREGARERSQRSLLVVPMLREGNCVGAIAVNRAEPGSFTDHQVNLLKTFADQAVIAIENVRLFNETKEALERQTATAEILKVISSSPDDLQPVFDAILENALRLCDAHMGVLGFYDGMRYRTVAHRGAVADYARWLGERGAFEPPAGSVLGRMIDGRRPVHELDLKETAGYREGSALTVRSVDVGGMRTLVAVPMLKEGRVIGGIVIYRREVRAFEQKQIDLVRTFASQAVIAIENVRLFNETKEALERQTATAEILHVISSSRRDLRPVFDTILGKAMQLCEAHLGFLGLYDGERYEHVAQRGSSPEFAKWIARGPFVPDPRMVIARALRERKPVHEADLGQSEGYRARVEPMVKTVEVGGARTMVAVPMVKEDRAVGGIIIYRPEVRPFTQKQIDLVSTFASQAVIAIENVRLFKQLEERTEALSKSVQQLTALGEVGQAISSTLDLETVLKTIVSRAVQLTGLDFGTIYEFDEATREFDLRAWENMPQNLVEIYRRMPIRLGEGIVGKAVESGEPVQVPDIQDPGYQTRYRDVLLRQGYRAILAVPLMRDERIIGALTVSRTKPGAFPPEVVELLKTFATQSALAIQNARLFREIAEKSYQLEEASKHKSQFLASMSHELRTPLNAILGFNEMLLGDVYGPLPEDMQPPLAQMQTSGKHLLRLINNVLDLAKIEAGRMELALSDYSVHDTVESVRATLRPLAEAKGLDFVVELPAELPLAHGDPGRITQCLMNLAGNSLKFTKAGRVQISVAEQNGLLVYRVADTGIGIPADKIGSLFTEFRQTDATIASEFGGTGLGLSISKKFIEMHGGRIWAESEPGQGSTFIFEIPLRAGEGKAA